MAISLTISMTIIIIIIVIILQFFNSIYYSTHHIAQAAKLGFCLVRINNRHEDKMFTNFTSHD